MSGKPFSSSLTVWLSGVLAAIGAAMAQFPDLLTAALGFFASDQVQSTLSMLPPKAKEAVDAIVQVIGALLVLCGAVSAFIRVARTKTAVAPPRLPFRGAGVFALIASAILLSSCATARADFKFPDISEITTPDKADDVLYAGTLAYQFVVGSINALHDAGVFPDSTHQTLITRDGSAAYRVRDGLKKGSELVDRWRSTGDPLPFATFYPELTQPYADLKRAFKRRGRP